MYIIYSRTTQINFGQNQKTPLKRGRAKQSREDKKIKKGDDKRKENTSFNDACIRKYVRTSAIYFSAISFVETAQFFLIFAHSFN